MSSAALLRQEPTALERLKSVIYGPQTCVSESGALPAEPRGRVVPVIAVLSLHGRAPACSKLLSHLFYDTLLKLFARVAAGTGYHTFEAFFHYVCVLTSIHPTSTCMKMIYNGKQINIYVNWIALTTEQHIFFRLNCTSRPTFKEALKHILSRKHAFRLSGDSGHA